MYGCELRLVWELTLMDSGTCSVVKVIGQRLKSVEVATGMNIDELTNIFSDFQAFCCELQCKATSAYDVMSWHHLMSCMEVAWRSGRVSGSHARDPGLIPGLATSRPTQAFHASNL